MALRFYMVPSSRRPLTLKARLLAGLLLTLALLMPAGVQAQQTETTGVRLLVPEARAHVLLADTLLDFRTRPVPGGRRDADSGVLRAAYDVQTQVPSGLTPDAAARAYIQAAAPDFGWAPEADDLSLHQIRAGRYSSHVEFQQTFFGVPVYNRRVKVSLNADRQPTMIVSGYAPHLARITTFNPTPTLSADAAATRTRALVREGAVRTSTPELLVYPGKPPRLAWRLIAAPDAAPVEWEVLIDAHTGALIHMLDQGTHAHAPVKPTPPPHGGAMQRVPTTVALEGGTMHRVPTGQIQNRVDGSGLAFDPDPLSSAGVPYGSPYVDADDTDVPELNAQRRTVVLRDLTQGSDGRYRLEGPYVRIDSLAGGSRFRPPAELDPHGFRYLRSNQFFEAVMVYYHIDKSQRHVQSLDIGHQTQSAPIAANPHGLGNAENSRYWPASNTIAFGDGGIDDAEDADVIWHEYAHALLEGSSPDLRNSGDGQALHEGWADYWAASYSRFLSEENPTIPAHDWRKVFSWDGNNGCWQGRSLDHDGHYPDDMEYRRTAGPGCLPQGTIYQQGLLWATTLMDIYPLLGRNVLDRLNLASHRYLGVPVTFVDAAEALIQADVDLYGGAHVDVLRDRLGARGYIDPTAFGPVLAHEALLATEQQGGTVPVAVSLTTGTTPVREVRLLYGYNASPSQPLVLTSEGGNRYTGALPLPNRVGTVRYFIEATDEQGFISRLPVGAPQQTYAFAVGPDHAPPQVVHNEVRNAPLLGWPTEIVAEVSDNLGVDSVWVEYRIEDPESQLTAEGTFVLQPDQGLYAGLFPEPASKVQAQSLVRYRILAEDRAQARNRTVLPADGWYAFTLVAEGVVRAFDFEGLGQPLPASGAWQRGTPAYGLHVAHSGDLVWATNPSGPYPAVPHHASLQMPPFDLRGLGDAYLTFWHWYDFEHTGTVAPGTPSQAQLWDGANVKVSTDGGQTWTIVTPVGGYNGLLVPNLGNPIGGEPGFGGYSYGWRQEVIPLPAAADVRVRFDFGSDDSNVQPSRFEYAGWYLDDVSITTRLPDDEVAPVFMALPQQSVVRAAGEALPLITTTVADDEGVEAVFADYVLERANDTQEGTLRLEMNPTDRRSFLGRITSTQGLGVGDRIAYRLRARDFAGNETVYTTGERPFEIRYVLTARATALESVRPSGRWRAAGDTWIVEPGAAPDAVSSLTLQPIDLPANALVLHFVLQHSYLFGASTGGNVKLSTDGGRTWNVLAPEGGYPALLSAEGHPMDGQPVFGGRAETVSTVFDLSDYSGSQVRLRVDLATGGAQGGGTTRWEIAQADLAYTTDDRDGFDVPRTLALHPNFPDPFSGTTTISYTLPEPQAVRMEVFDVLGRRIEMLANAEQAAGTYTLTYDGTRLASGLYLLRMQAGTTVFTERLVVAR